MPPKAILFDFDDTLLDHTSSMEASWTLVCTEFAPLLGCDAALLRQAIRREAVSFWQDESKVGPWRTDLIGAREHVVRLALTAEGWDASHARAISQDYDDDLHSRLELFEDALPTLERLRSAGFRMAMITNGPAEQQRRKVLQFGMDRHMDAVVIEGEFGRGKPEREVFLHALGAVGCDPDDAWMVGDNLYADIGGARSAGIDATWIHRDRVQFREDLGVKPHRRIAHLDELLAALDLS